MSTTPPPGPPPGQTQGSQWGPPPGGFGWRIEEAMELIQMELRHAVAYVNAAVVPQVRRESISAMRSVAETLHNLADRFEKTPNPPGAPGEPPKGPKL